MGRKMVLTKDARDEILRLRGELDERGRQRWTYEQIAEKLGVSLATAYRAAAGVAGYSTGRAEKGKPVQETPAAMAAREARLRQLAEVGLDDTGVDYLLEQRQRERELGITGELSRPASV
jgi:transcriptional regulator with XRE-family HTH domain